LIQAELCTRDNERGIKRGVGVHVGICKLELINPDGSVVVRVRISELSARLVWDVKNGYGEADEEQPFLHRSDLARPVPQPRFPARNIIKISP
jgi:hypothetical protein